ncbi:MAG: fumarylacetoacetate hydrolase family protein [Chitinophagales bacterium]|nr:fumarylacetoacetate hydrolase family protein [Chitinophagales bacterium]MDW8392646.1 fumarylacetoacetate hydrolase family protein [Chitinophagales bacterium]
MKIICVARNYAAHARELNNDLPQQPVLFLKPDTALKRKNLPFFLPDFSSNIHYETELVFRICKTGKNIEERFAMRYVDQVTVGIDFTARDLQEQQKRLGLPWEIAKAFDGSACIGDWRPLKQLGNTGSLNFHLTLNDRIVQRGTAADMIFPVSRLIAYASRFFLLLEGDLLFTGTPEGVGSVQPNDVLRGYLNEEPVLECRVK